MAQNGIDALNNRRARRTRQAPAPRHPAAPTALAVVPDKVDDTPEAVQPEPGRPAPAEATPVQPAPPVDELQESARAAAVKPPAAATRRGAPDPVETAPVAATPVVIEQPKPEPAPRASGDLPALDIDLRDPEAQIVSPTVMSIPESIVARFDKARSKAPSHTAVVLNALRQHAHELPALILARRPGPTPGDLFPWRESPGDSAGETPLPLRIRPTKAELKVMETLQDWSTIQIRAQRPGARKTNRSEMVAAALDAYLPQQPNSASKKAAKRSTS